MHRILAYIDTCSCIAVTLIGVYLFKKLTAEFKIFTIFLVYASVTAVVSTIMGSLKIHNLYLFNILAIVEYLISAYLLFEWAENKYVSFLIVISSIVFSLLWYWSTFSIMGFQEYNFYIKMLQSVIMVFFSGILLVNISDFTKKNMLYDGRFWIGVSWLMYFSILSIVYIFSGIMMKGNLQIASLGSIVKSGANIFEYILFAIALICSSLQRRSYLA